MVVVRSQWIVWVGILLLLIYSIRILFHTSLPSLRSSSYVSPTKLSSAFVQFISSSSSSSPCGIILPLYQEIVPLGLSLVYHLQHHMNVSLPIEIPHCGDLNPSTITRLSTLPLVRVYDVCQKAMTIHPNVFCTSVNDCHTRFRSFYIKILALVLSDFSQIMLLDADTLFFLSPLDGFKTQAFTTTGTLFFHDRISYEQSYLAQRITTSSKIGRMQQYLSFFPTSLFQSIPTLARETTPLTRLLPLSLSFSFEPSSFLLTSHSWTMRAGHQMDSSLVLWDKDKQPRATAILAYMISLEASLLPSVPSYGDKEYYFLACELAETQYAFSFYGVGTIGTNESAQDHGPDHSTLCGDALHYYPASETEDNPRPFFINSDHMLTWSKESVFYRTKAHNASWYPSQSFTQRQIPQECPFESTLIRLSPSESMEIRQRQEIYQQVVQEWKENDYKWWSLFF